MNHPALALPGGHLGLVVLIGVAVDDKVSRNRLTMRDNKMMFRALIFSRESLIIAKKELILGVITCELIKRIN